ncbi:hypothetical protein OROMI_010463 [Orobanche minor]
MNKTLHCIGSCLSNCSGCTGHNGDDQCVANSYVPPESHSFNHGTSSGPGLNSRSSLVMENGVVQVTLSKPEGIVTGIRYGGIDNLLEVLNRRIEVIGIFSGMHQEAREFLMISGTDFRIIVENEDQVELSFTRMWDPSLEGNYVPLNIDKRFILLRGSSGFYSYAIYEHLQEWPGFDLGETRITFKLRKDKF